jgi:hypothetical protein
MSAKDKDDRKRRQANEVAVEIIRVDGTHETAVVNRGNWLKQIEQLIGANCLDSVDLRDGRVMFVDDRGYPEKLPDNAEATALYHKVCKPGTTHRIKGDVVIGRDEDFS